jgi:ubiquinone/menaquinone biosynthesis C-methylase UbiE
MRSQNGDPMTNPKINNPKYLKEKQYKDSSNLDKRINLHQLYSTNQYGWMPWVFDQLDLPLNSNILELGCGPGDLWLENLTRIPEGWQIMLSDLSDGMLANCQDRLAHDRRFKFEILDAGNLPWHFIDESFDAVIANHMLYHLPDIEKTIAEIIRVLNPGGYFYATTIGQDHLKELDELLNQLNPTMEKRNKSIYNFTLENGAESLSNWFSKVQMRTYKDALHVTETTPLVEYVYSGWFATKVQNREQLENTIKTKIAANDGIFHISKASGIFIAQKR